MSVRFASGDAYPDSGCYLVRDHRDQYRWALWRVRPEGDYLLVGGHGDMDKDTENPVSSGFSAALGYRLPVAKARALEFAAQHLNSDTDDGAAWLRMAARFATQHGELAWDMS